MIRRIAALAAIVCLGAAVTLPVGAAPVAAQADDGAATTEPTVDIEFVSASPWVESEGVWAAEFAVTGAPADARVSYSIRQAVTGSGSESEIREALAKSRDGEDEPKVLQAPVGQDLAAITDATGVTRLEIAVRSKSANDKGRVFIPNSGVYPVVISVMAADRTTLARTTLALNRLPTAAAPRGAPFRLGILVQHDLTGGFDDEGNVEITPALRSQIAATTDLLGESSSLPLTIDVSPETIVALTQSRTAGDLELVEQLRDRLGASKILRVPWADLHVEGWAETGSLANVETSMVDGRDALEARLPDLADMSIWPADPTMGPSGVELLTRLGIPAVLVDSAQLTDGRPPPDESGSTRPFRIAGSASSTITAVALDPDLQSLLSTSSTTPGLTAHQMLTVMFGSWLADDSERGTILRIDDSADPDVVSELIDLLRRPAPDSGAPISVVDLAEITALPPIVTRQSGKEVPYVRELVAPTDVPQVGGISDRLRRARPLIDDYASIVPSGDPAAARLAITIQRSLDRRLTTSVQEQLLDEAITEMETDLGRISASEPRSITLTTRRTTVPLRFTNDLGRPITVRLRLQSPRLVFLDGEEQLLTLNPGLNRLNVGVEVQASGQFVLQADLLAPDTDRVLASTRQRIRSQTFSGVGLMLSGGALLFLVIWWSRTLRKRRNEPDPRREVPSDESVGAHS